MLRPDELTGSARTSAPAATSDSGRDGARRRPQGPDVRPRSGRRLSTATAPGFDRRDAVALADASRLERDLTFEGVILFSDPPKPDVGEAIASLADQGIALKIITGDNDLVARHVAGLVGLEVDGVLTGDQMRRLTHPALVARAPRTTIFARVDPDQKLQVIRALRESGHVVGYMGDGINDAPALHVADVGISVDNATDVARSAADIILLEPSLAAISQGVTEGRRTFANTLKYIRMGTSSNFGNMLSMAGAALVLPFLPMLPEPDPAEQPHLRRVADGDPVGQRRCGRARPSRPAGTSTPSSASWSSSGRSRRSSTTSPSALLLLMLGNSAKHEDSFQAGWFVESLFTQILVVLVIRTAHVAVLAEPAEQAAGSGDRGGAGRGGDHPAEPARAGAALVRRAAVAVLAAAGRTGRRLPDPHRDRQAHLRPARGAATRSDRPSKGQDVPPAERFEPVVDRGGQVVEDGGVVLLERRDDLENQGHLLHAALAQGVDDPIRVDAAARGWPRA